MRHKIKDFIFYKLIEKNPHILKDYQMYKWAHSEKKENKIKSWTYIINLNIKYRLLKIQNSSISDNKKRTEFNQNNTPKKLMENTDASKKNNSKRIAKFPYLDGAESEVLRRPTPLQFVKQLMAYDVISFDIFDTLLLRPLAKPQHLFMILGDKHNCVNFMSIRMEAEREARNLAAIKKGNREVTIYDIYELIQLRTGIEKNYGVQVELETELNLCFANPYMKEVFEIVKSQNKKIIAISDMYLPKDMIVQLLEKSGYTGFQEVFVSSESNCSKRDKFLFKMALKKFDKTTRIIHVGDNYETDILSAKELGIATKHYNNVHEVGNKYRADGMSELIGSTYSGIINTHLHNGIKQYSPHYEFGFIYGGLYVLGYCKWIYDYAKKNNIDKILFLSRDGDIYQKVFNFLYKDMKNEYVYWSRIANTKYTIDKNRDDFLTRMVLHKALGVTEVTMKGLLKSLDLDEMISLLSKYNLNEDEIVHKGNVKLVEQFFVDNWEIVVEKLSEENEIVKEYFEKAIEGSKRVAVVDVGWIGSGGAGIKYLIEEKWNLDCKVYSLVAASRYWNHTANINQIMKNETEPYIFSRMYNRNLYDWHSNTNKGTNNIFFELFTQARYPSFAGFKKNESGYKLLFDVPEIENYKITEKIHKGIFDFVKIYNDTFSEYEYLFNITGYDAYLPFRMIIKDISFIKKYFGDVLYSRGVLADTENQVFEKLTDILEQANI